MKYEAALTAEANETASDHLLQHIRKGERQEDLCFALWQPSTGARRVTALIDRIITPEPGERDLHGNASFQSRYAARAVAEACRRGSGLAFMHSHPHHGWQPLSVADARAEQKVLAPVAGAAGLPLVGLTVGNDGYWSARFWRKGQSRPDWCDKVRIAGPKSYVLRFNDRRARPSPRREVLKRTHDSWGDQAQNDISRLRVGIAGLGSVGCIVAEAMARIGVRDLTLIDPDRVETHNLDRLLYGTTNDVGRLKVELAKDRMELHATADRPQITALPLPVQDNDAYLAALDCDIIFSCVDRPVARDVLNHIANAHLVPVIDCGVSVGPLNRHGQFSHAHWRAHIVTPYHQCLRCNGQYNTGMVSAELDGSLDNPSYISALPKASRPEGQNVFPFSLGVAGMAVNLMLRYLLSPDWWPEVKQQDCQFITGQTRVINERCQDYCPFPARKAGGDRVKPSYIKQ